MFGIIKKIFKLIYPIIMGLIMAISLPLYFLSLRVTDRENMRTWLKTDNIKEAYQDYITQKITDDTNLSIITLLIPEQEITSLIDKQINTEWIENSIDEAVDSTYDWLEGKKGAKSTVDVSNHEELSSILQPSTGAISELLGLSNDSLFNVNIPLIDLNKQFTELLPKTYTQLTLLPNRLLILNAILLAILVFSSKNGREASFRLGLSFTIAGGILIFGPNYISENPQSLSIIGINLESLPQLSELPLYAQEVVKLATLDITKDITNYTIIAFVAGIAFIVLSQLELKEVEVWDGVNGRDSKDFEDSEESEE